MRPTKRRMVISCWIRGASRAAAPARQQCQQRTRASSNPRRGFDRQGAVAPVFRIGANSTSAASCTMVCASNVSIMRGKVRGAGTGLHALLRRSMVSASIALGHNPPPRAEHHLLAALRNDAKTQAIDAVHRSSAIGGDGARAPEQRSGSRHRFGQCRMAQAKALVAEPRGCSAE